MRQEKEGRIHTEIPFFSHTPSLFKELTVLYYSMYLMRADIQIEQYNIRKLPSVPTHNNSPSYIFKRQCLQ